MQCLHLDSYSEAKEKAIEALSKQVNDIIAKSKAEQKPLYVCYDFCGFMVHHKIKIGFSPKFTMESSVYSGLTMFICIGKTIDENESFKIEDNWTIPYEDFMGLLDKQDIYPDFIADDKDRIIVSGL